MSLAVPDGADPVQRVVDPGSVVLGEIAYLQRETDLPNEQNKHPPQKQLSYYSK